MQCNTSAGLQIRRIERQVYPLAVHKYHSPGVFRGDAFDSLVIVLRMIHKGQQFRKVSYQLLIDRSADQGRAFRVVLATVMVPGISPSVHDRLIQPLNGSGGRTDSLVGNSRWPGGNQAAFSRAIYLSTSIFIPLPVLAITFSVHYAPSNICLSHRV